jgi:hypothetical protein
MHVLNAVLWVSNSAVRHLFGFFAAVSAPAAYRDWCKFVFCFLLSLVGPTSIQDWTPILSPSVFLLIFNILFLQIVHAFHTTMSHATSLLMVPHTA